MPGADLNELVVFARVVETGSFTAAAAALDMPKSTVSRKVTELEARLRARLLQRTTRKLSVTDAGRAYYAHAARVVAELEEAENAVGRLLDVPRGPLRVTTPLNFAFLGPVLTDFASRYPEVVLDVVATDRVVDLVDEGFDVAIRAGRLADSTLIVRPLSAITWVVVAGSRYLRKRGRPKAPADLARHDALVFGSGPTPSQWRLVAGEQTASVLVKPRLVVNDFVVLLSAVRADLGVAMVPSYLAVAEIRRKRLEHVLPAWASPRSSVHVVYPSIRHLSPKVKAFVEHLKERFSPPPWELGPALE